ncbi:MAG: hypothetical protein IIA61_11240 [Candidatus Marinimicrobia bacterium]|nr:hypothetical protein [Candidatus Neomarinimicrobiota bacterium]
MNNRLFLATLFKLRFDIGEWLAVNGAQTNVWSGLSPRLTKVGQVLIPKFRKIGVAVHVLPYESAINSTTVGM